MKANPSKQYDDMAELYAKKNESSLHNAFYERPATKAIMPDIKGKKVLDAGCGSGSLTEWLVAQGADVIACDISEEMVKYTKKRLGDRAQVLVADLSKPLDFILDHSIDVIVSSLVLHYISNWLDVFTEFSRILKKNGYVVFSTHHPHADWRWFNKSNYFKKELYSESWSINGQSYPVSYYHRTLASMFAIFRTVGFFVDILLEPLPIKEAKEKNPEIYERLLANPHFIFFRLIKST